MSIFLALPTASNLDTNLRSFFNSTICPLLVFTLAFLSIVENVFSFVALSVAKRSGSSINNCSDIKVLHLCSPISFAEIMSLDTLAGATFPLAILTMLSSTSKGLLMFVIISTTLDTSCSWYLICVSSMSLRDLQ